MTDYTKPCNPVPCPDFEQVDLGVTGSAPVGHVVVDGFIADQHARLPEDCFVCRGWQLLLS